MNNNLPQDPTINASEEALTDTNLDTNKDSHVYAAPATTYGEVVDTSDDTYNESNPEDTQFALSALENVIRQRLTIIEKSQLEISELGQQLKDILANSEEYYKAEKVAKEAMKKKKEVKATIMGTQEARTLQGKFDEAKQMLKDQENSLSEMLLEYYETMHVKEIDDGEGQTRDLIVRVKIAPKKLK